MGFRSWTAALGGRGGQHDVERVERLSAEVAAGFGQRTTASTDVPPHFPQGGGIDWLRSERGSLGEATLDDAGFVERLAAFAEEGGGSAVVVVGGFRFWFEHRTEGVHGWIFESGGQSGGQNKSTTD